jgi:hypothetical protein
MSRSLCWLNAVHNTSWKLVKSSMSTWRGRQIGLLKTFESAHAVQCQMAGLLNRSNESQRMWEEAGGCMPEFVWTDCAKARKTCLRAYISIHILPNEDKKRNSLDCGGQSTCPALAAYVIRRWMLGYICIMSRVTYVRSGRCVRQIDKHVGLLNFGNNVHKSVPSIFPSKNFEEKREPHFGHSQINPYFKIQLISPGNTQGLRFKYSLSNTV